MRVFVKNRKKDPMLISLFVGAILLSWYCSVPWSSWLAKMTLLSMSQSGRAILEAGILNMLLLLYALHISEKRFPIIWGIMCASLYSIGIVAWLSKQYPELYLGGFTFIILRTFLIGYMVAFLATGGKGIRGAVVQFISFCSGGVYCESFAFWS